MFFVTPTTQEIANNYIFLMVQTSETSIFSNATYRATWGVTFTSSVLDSIVYV